MKKNPVPNFRTWKYEHELERGIGNININSYLFLHSIKVLRSNVIPVAVNTWSAQIFIVQ